MKRIICWLSLALLVFSSCGSKAAPENVLSIQCSNARCLHHDSEAQGVNIAIHTKLGAQV